MWRLASSAMLLTVNMGYSNCHLYIVLRLCILMAFARATTSNAKVQIPALFTFGDSIADPGNNNYIRTVLKANHPPYGLNFARHIPTGRYCDGKLSTDFIASFLGLKKTLPPFLHPRLNTQQFLTGVSFASAGSGYDNLTAMVVNAIPLSEQVQIFKKYKAKLVDLVGAKNSSNIIGEAIFIVVAGTNDFGQNYYFFPTRRKQFNISQYQQHLLQSCRSFVQDMYRLGARKIFVYGLPAQGCVPPLKTLHGQPNLKGCMDKFNRVAISYNRKLRVLLGKLNSLLPGSKVVYVHIYDVFLDLVKNHAKYGFLASNRGCCGSGLVEIGPTCNATTPVTCPDPSKYVFWDAVHPSQRSYEILAKFVFNEYISELL